MRHRVILNIQQFADPNVLDRLLLPRDGIETCGLLWENLAAFAAAVVLGSSLGWPQGEVSLLSRYTDAMVGVLQIGARKLEEDLASDMPSLFEYAVVAL